MMARPVFSPMTEPLLIDGHGFALMPHAYVSGFHLRTFVAEGMGMTWTPLSADRIILCLVGGNPAAPTNEALATSISRNGLRELIADLQSIDRQMEPTS